MDYSLLALIALIVLTVVLSTKQHRGSWPGGGSYQYRRVFSVGAFGLWLTVAGAIGWDLRYVRGFFQGTTWVDAPIWWQIGLGLALLALAVVLARKVSYPAPRPQLDDTRTTARS